MANEFDKQLEQAENSFSEDVVDQVFNTLKLENKTISVAESVTGGLISAKLTGYSGSSDIFIGGSVCYSVSSKVAMAGADPKVIAEKGVVSKDTAISLAKGIRKKLNTAIGIGVTGVAGPTAHGGQNPGTVFIAIANLDEVIARGYYFEGTRDQIRESTVQGVFLLLKYELENRKILLREKK